MNHSSKTALIAAALCLVGGIPAASWAQQTRTSEAQNPCGAIVIRNFYGPYDYRTHRGSLQVVEDFHFTPEIEAGLRGKNGPIGGDIDYTLKASPNHHRALATLMGVTRRLKNDQLPGMTWPMECYFDRAIRYQRDDPVVRMLYAQFLTQRKRTDDARRQLEVATELAQDNPFTHYNVGLLYFELGQYDRALVQAHRAKELGLPREDLAEMLRKAGQWRERQAPSPSATAAAAPAAASGAGN